MAFRSTAVPAMSTTGILPVAIQGRAVHAADTPQNLAFSPDFS